MKRRLLTNVMFVLVFFVALGVTLYPLISNHVNEKYKSEIHTAYVEIIEEADDSALVEAKARAVEYNNAITPGTMDGNAYSQEALKAASEDYDSQLNIGGDGIMGYVEIPIIGVNLPIYHGTETDSLDRRVGHLLGSSLPVGGESTHAILSGHSGMATEKMFTDVTQLQIGDVFYLHVLKDTLAYQVVETNTVLPYDRGSRVLRLAACQNVLSWCNLLKGELKNRKCMILRCVALFGKVMKSVTAGQLLSVIGRGDTLLFLEDPAEIERIVVANDRGNFRYIIVRALQ